MLAVAILAVGVTTTVAIAATAAVLTERHRIAGVADAAALAAADVAAGVVAGTPCDAASQLAETNHAGLRACALDGTTVTLDVESHRSGLLITGRATAGQTDREERRSIDAYKK